MYASQKALQGQTAKVVFKNYNYHSLRNLTINQPAGSMSDRAMSPQTISFMGNKFNFGNRFNLRNYSEHDKSEKERLKEVDTFVPKISERTKMLSNRKRIKTQDTQSIHDALHQENQ